MLKQEQTRLLKGLLNHLDAKTNVDAGGIIKAPAETYTSKERFDLEWDLFFQDYPQIIGMSGDLAEPNSFQQLKILALQLLPPETLMVNLKLSPMYALIEGLKSKLKKKA